MDRQFSSPARVASPAEWATRLDRERHATAVEALGVREPYAELQRRFRQLVRQIKLNLGDGRLPIAEQSQFAAAVAHILENSRLLFAELNRIGSNGAPRLAPPETLDELLQATQSQLERLQQQFALAGECDEFCRELHRFCQVLLHEPRDGSNPPVYSGLRPLVASLRARERHAPSLQELLPALPLMRLERQFGRPAARGYFAGVITGCLAARVASRLWMRDDHVELLISAALLHDVGLLLLPPHALLDDDDVWHPLRGRYERHPQIGQALVEGIDRAPTALGRMTCLHHERLNGTGYPRGRLCGAWTELAELLAVIARWHDLRVRNAASVTLHSDREDVERMLVEALAKETRRGAFRPEILARVLDREVDPSWLGEGEMRAQHAGTEGTPPAPHLPAVASASPAPIDGPPLDGPQFRRAAPGGRRRGVRTPGRRRD
jgi:hypothetical protein